MTTAHWIAVDWGTSNLRAWALSDEGRVLDSAESDRGMARLTAPEYPGALTGLAGDWIEGAHDPVDVLICGMAGARQGWREAPYIEMPADLSRLGQHAVAPDMPDDRLRPRILSGVCQRTPGAEDVMRGEETQILGLLTLKPGFAGTVCMPGTHSKWVSVADSIVTGFATALTGELFDVLRTHSVLRHTLPDDPVGADTEDGIAAGLEAGTRSPEKLTGKLFRTRAAGLVAGKSPHWCAGYLSGLLVGAETAGHRDWIGSGPIQLIGSARLCRLYARALDMLGAPSETVDVADATLAGLTAAREQIK